ncbi:winged helix-turn-helix domain-containing protein, partial [Mesorhizobium sp. M1A.F.Ca.IN.022.05.2.1]|uniref:GntR family transcriptional regulator n=1 Tax=Mesorhizobium sp. M1A.F.Ca.IN.022.05.2.1 TaxID=2496760 RepID=UPI0019D0176E
SSYVNLYREADRRGRLSWRIDALAPELREAIMLTTLLNSSSSLHESVREEIHNRIKKGMYKPEELIPSAAMLTEEFGVSAITIKRALRDLQAAGVLVSVAGKGTYVKKRQKKVVRKLDVHFPNYEGATIKLIATTREIIT